MTEERDLLRNVSPEQEEAVIKIASKEQRKLGLDWKISIPSVCAAAVVVAGYVWVLSEKSAALEEVQKTTELHSRQLAELDHTTVATNLDVAGIKGDIKEILAILHHQDDHRSP